MDPMSQSMRAKTKIPAKIVRKGGPWAVLVSPLEIASFLPMGSSEGLLDACSKGNLLPVTNLAAFLNLTKWMEKLIIIYQG